MSYSSPRKVISSFVVVYNSNIYMRTNPKPSQKFENDEHFGFSYHAQYSNFIGDSYVLKIIQMLFTCDSIYIQDGPRAVPVSETGEKYTLGSDEVIEIVDGKKVREKIDHQDPQRKRRSKSATNLSTRLNRKHRPSFTLRISSSVHSQEQLDNSKSICSNIGTQTQLERYAITIAQHRGPKSCRRVRFSIPLEFPSPQSNEKAYGNRAQPLSHQVTPFPSTVTISEANTQASFKGNIF